MTKAREISTVQIIIDDFEQKLIRFVISEDIVSRPHVVRNHIRLSFREHGAACFHNKWSLENGVWN